MNSFSTPTMPDDMYGFTMTALMDIIKDFSTISVPRVAIGYILMVTTVVGFYRNLFVTGAKKCTFNDNVLYTYCFSFHYPWRLFSHLVEKTEALIICIYEKKETT